MDFFDEVAGSKFNFFYIVCGRCDIPSSTRSHLHHVCAVFFFASFYVRYVFLPTEDIGFSTFNLTFYGNSHCEPSRKGRKPTSRKLKLRSIFSVIMKAEGVVSGVQGVPPRNVFIDQAVFCIHLVYISKWLML